MSASSLHRESTDSLITGFVCIFVGDGLRQIIDITVDVAVFKEPLRSPATASAVSCQTSNDAGHALGLLPRLIAWLQAVPLMLHALYLSHN